MSWNPTPKECGLLDNVGLNIEYGILGGSTRFYSYEGSIVKELGYMS